MFANHIYVAYRPFYLRSFLPQKIQMVHEVLK